MVTLVSFEGAHVNDLVLGHHFVLKRPAEATAQLGDDSVAVTKKVNVKVDVGDGLSRDIDLRNVRGQPAHNLGDRGDLEGCADDDDEINLVAVVFGEAAGELVGQSLAEEGNIGLHDASGGDVVLGRVVVRRVICRPTTTTFL